MSFTQKELRITTCKPAAHNTFSQADNESALHIPVILTTPVSTDLFPTVGKTAADEDPIYGKFNLYQDNGETSTTSVGVRRVGVITAGIVRFTADTANAIQDADIGKGIAGSSVANTVKISGTAGTGCGRIVGHADSGTTVWVDLDAGPIK